MDKIISYWEIGEDAAKVKLKTLLNLNCKIIVLDEIGQIQNLHQGYLLISFW